MAQHPDYVLRENARRGAITTWCPECKRKSALSAYLLGGIRKCRYCGNVEKRFEGERRRLYQKWIESNGNG